MGLMNYLLRDRHGTCYLRRVIPTGLPDSLRQTPLRELVKRDKELAHLTGHAGGGGVGRGYGRGFGLKAMAAEMAKIEAPEAVRGLRWSEAEAGEVPRAAKNKNR